MMVAHDGKSARLRDLSQPLLLRRSFQSSSSSLRAAGAAGFLTFNPVARAAGDVARADTLGDDALAAERRRVLQDQRAVTLKVLDIADRQTRWQKLVEPSLTILDWMAAQVGTVEFNQIEREQQNVCLDAGAIAQLVEDGEAAAIDHHHFAVDDARPAG
jgi:hypothetical protein